MSQIKWVITIIIIMATIAYLNQEVPACVDNPIAKNVSVQLNYTAPEVDQLNTQIASNVVVFETSGSSMLPIIKDQQRCACLRTNDYQLGDIVVFFGNSGEGFEGIAHEIISIDGENITTKGVNNKLADLPIKQENVLCEIPQIKRWEMIQYGK